MERVTAYVPAYNVSEHLARAIDGLVGDGFVLALLEIWQQFLS
jgi:hypothetical protein